MAKKSTSTTSGSNGNSGNGSSAAGKKHPIDRATVRMYRMGTGDCFIIKFFSRDEEKERFKMMIDCGTWQRSKAHLSKYIKDLKAYVDNSVDALVVTHEHKDHVHVFDACEDLFTTDFTARETWMAWAENDARKDVKDLKRNHGAQKKALALAAEKFTAALRDKQVEADFKAQHRGLHTLNAYRHFGEVLDEFTELQYAPSTELGVYAGPLAGMDVVKKKITPGAGRKPNLRFFEPGDVMEDIEGLEGIRIYVLGPPNDWDAIKAEETSEEGEIYEHNKELAKGDAFAAAVNALGTAERPQGLLPFDTAFEAPARTAAKAAYNDPKARWRRIDNDWLMSAGSLALRLTSGINNLSLALAIEFIESGRVMLFPGDAEYGSWASWHDIAWQEEGRGKHSDGTPKHLTEDLLNRTVFYKVAHHISHNGTAKRKGLEMMKHKDLAAMATLDYSVISNGWKGTMPNEGILKDLLRQTRGRLMIMRTDDLFLNARKTIKLGPRITARRAEMSPAEAAAFKKAHPEPKKTDLYLDYEVKG